MKTKRICHNFKKWEDYKNGFYQRKTKLCNKTVKRNIQLLSDPKVFYSISKKLLKEWPISTEHNLTDTSLNRKAYIGRMACNYLNGSTIGETNKAWQSLSNSKKETANQVADKIIKQFKQIRTRQCQRNIWG